MASVYLRVRDKHMPKSEQCYYITYTDAFRRRRDIKGYASKERTKKLAAKIDAEVALVKRGLCRPAASAALFSIERERKCCRSGSAP